VFFILFLSCILVMFLMYLDEKWEISRLIIWISVGIHFLALLWPDVGPNFGRNYSSFNKHVIKVTGDFFRSFSFLVYLNLSKIVPEHYYHIASYLPSINSSWITGHSVMQFCVVRCTDIVVKSVIKKWSHVSDNWLISMPKLPLELSTVPISMFPSPPKGDNYGLYL